MIFLQVGTPCICCCFTNGSHDFVQTFCLTLHHCEMVCQKWLHLCPSFFLAYFWQSRWCDNDWLLIRCFRIHRDYLVANSRVHFFLTCIIYYVEAQSRESAAPIFVILIWKVMQKPQECHACWCLFHRLFPSTYTTTISSWFHPPISFNGNRTVRCTRTTWTVKNIYFWFVTMAAFSCFLKNYISS